MSQATTIRPSSPSGEVHGTKVARRIAKVHKGAELAAAGVKVSRASDWARSQEEETRERTAREVPVNAEFTHATNAMMTVSKSVSKHYIKSQIKDVRTARLYGALLDLQRTATSASMLLHRDFPQVLENPIDSPDENFLDINRMHRSVVEANAVFDALVRSMSLVQRTQAKARPLFNELIATTSLPEVPQRTLVELAAGSSSNAGKSLYKHVVETLEYTNNMDAIEFSESETEADNTD